MVHPRNNPRSSLKPQASVLLDTWMLGCSLQRGLPLRGAALHRRRTVSEKTPRRASVRSSCRLLHRVWSSRSVQDRVFAAARTDSSDARGSPATLEERCPLHSANDWVFASKRYRGRRPIWGQAILRKSIRPVAQRTGIERQFGWHTFRHTYSTLLRGVGTEFKVMQELLRHSTLRSTLDVYTQAVTPAKHAAQAAVVSLVFSSSAGGGSRIAGQEATVS